jgi:hypothetical protein
MPTRCIRCFLLQILLLAQHVSGTIMHIIRSSRVLYSWLPHVLFGAWFSSCRYGVALVVVCPVCGLQPANGTHNPKHLLHPVGILFPHSKYPRIHSPGTCKNARLSPFAVTVADFNKNYPEITHFI